MGEFGGRHLAGSFHFVPKDFTKCFGKAGNTLGMAFGTNLLPIRPGFVNMIPRNVDCRCNHFCLVSNFFLLWLESICVKVLVYCEEIDGKKSQSQT